MSLFDRSLILKKIFYLRSFFVKLWGQNIINLANLGQLTRDIIRAIKA